LYRSEIDIDDYNEQIKESCCLEVGDTVWALVNLLNALYHITVIDKIKQEIYFKYEINSCLRSIILFGNQMEQEYALNVLWQLCFDQTIGLNVMNDTILYDFIKSLCEKKIEAKNVSEKASGIIWILNKRNEKKNESNKDLLRTSSSYNNSNNGKHIMISYNRASRDLCLAIKQELEKNKFKVWIDVESISGSSLESMANAIEQSICILMCMTEKYKQSTNCR
jgi:hypothetical protein